MDGISMIIMDSSDAKNGRDNIVHDENSIEPDEEASLHRKIRPEPDMEAYARDEEAPLHRKVRPEPDMEAYAPDEEAV